MKKLFEKVNAALTPAEKIIYYATYCTLLVTLIFIVVQAASAPARSDLPYEKVKTDYALNVLQFAGALIIIHLPVVLEVRFTLKVPSVLNITYLVFLYCTVYLGEFRSFYYHVPFWDKILHTFGGAMLGALSFSVIAFLAGEETAKRRPALVAVFSLCFAVTVGVLWELYEYVLDSVGNLNMQKYADAAGNAFAGRAALADTMNDLIVDAFGAAAAAVIGYVSVRSEKRLFDKLLIKKRRELLLRATEFSEAEPAFARGGEPRAPFRSAGQPTALPVKKEDADEQAPARYAG